MTDKIRHPRYIAFLAVLIGAVALFDLIAPPRIGMVAGFDVAVLVFLVSCLPLWRHGGPQVMRHHARRDDANQLLLLLITGLISTVVLVAVSTLLLDRDALAAGETALVVVTLLASWVFTNVVFAFHYARLYYAPQDGRDHEGLAFPGSEAPDFSDFVNFAIVIGMTCQTADIGITRRSIRRVVTFHGLFAFFFNLGVLALVVNVLASAAG